MGASKMQAMDPFSAKRRAVITTIPLENTVLTFPTVVSKLLPTVLAPMAMSLMFHMKEKPSTLNTNPLPTPLLPTNPTLLPSTSLLPNPLLPSTSPTPLPSTTSLLPHTNPLLTTQLPLTNPTPLPPMPLPSTTQPAPNIPLRLLPLPPRLLPLKRHP